MTTRFQHLAVLAAAVVALCVSVPFAGAADAPMSRDEAHRQIQVAERAVPTTVETRSGSVGASRHLFEPAHEFPIRDRVPDDVFDEAMEMHVRLDRFDTEPHGQPLVGSDAEVLDPALEVPPKLARVRPGA